MATGRGTTFLTLPREIRSQILDELLKSPEPLSKVSRVVEIDSGNRQGQNDVYYWRFELGRPLRLQPQILAVCRQLFQEGTSVLYANTIVISFARCAFDVLGKWRVEDILQSSQHHSVPLLGRFRNIEFRVYMDFVDLRRLSNPNTVQDMCQAIVRANCGPWDNIRVVIKDGSDGARFTRAVAKWADELVGFEKLSCRTFTLVGDVPEGISTVSDILRLASPSSTGHNRDGHAGHIDSRQYEPQQINNPLNTDTLYVM